MNKKELAIIFGMVAIIMMALFTNPTTSTTDQTLASSFIQNSQEKFYVGQVGECNLHECYSNGKEAYCKCMDE